MVLGGIPKLIFFQIHPRIKKNQENKLGKISLRILGNALYYYKIRVILFWTLKISDKPARSENFNVRNFLHLM